MSVIEYIDLSENEVNKKKTMPIIQNVNGLQTNKSRLQNRPKTQALRDIGISLIRMQYGDKVKQNSNFSSLNGAWKPVQLKDMLWSSLWSDNENQSNVVRPFRQMLEERYEKSYQCPRVSNSFCYYKSKMTRIEWINHVRRGHLRIKTDWKKIFKNNPQTGISMIFEIFCAICSKDVNMKPLTPKDFILHIKNTHDHLLPHLEYYNFSQRCNVCNDKMKSFQQNIFHRKHCYMALRKDPNGPCTASFNYCFKNQRNKAIVSLEIQCDHKKTFQYKLKFCKDIYRSAFNYWLIRKNHSNVKISSKTPTNSINYYALIRKPKIFIESDWIGPNSHLIYNDPKTKFSVPVPFPLRNETNSKRVYDDWCSSIRPENSMLSKTNPWFCELCNGMLKNIFRAYPHLKMCHQNVIFCDNQCKSCDKRFITLQGFQKHIEDFKRCPVSKKCGLCGISVSANDIYNHLNDKHKDQFDKVLKLGSCLICREVVTDIFQHLFDVHGMSDLINSEQTDINQLTYRNGLFFNCPKCSFTFFSEIELRNHMISAKHHYQCLICTEKKFYMSWEFMQHKFTHHSDTIDLSCELCPVTETTIKLNSSTSNIEDANDCNFQGKSDLKLDRPSQKVHHFLQAHSSQCHVILENLEENNMMS